MRASSKGFTILELMISLGIIAIIAAIATGLYFNYITESESATVLSEISDAEKKVQIAIETDTDGLIHCDDTLLDFSQLASKGYLEVTVSPLPLDTSDPTAGNAPALIIEARVDKHGGEGINLARTLHEELSNTTNRVEDATVTDTIVTFAVRLNNSPACDNAVASVQQPTGQQPPAPAPDPAAQAATVSQCKSTETLFAGSCYKVCNDGFHDTPSGCARGDCPAGQVLDGKGYCNALAPPPAAAPPAGANPPVTPACRANEKVNSIDGSCMKACNDGWHLDGAKCAMGDCPAGQVLDGNGYCAAASPPPPPPPPPPPTPDTAATGQAPGATTAPAARQTSFDPKKALGENNRNPCPDGEALVPGQSLDPLPPVDQIQCQPVSKNMANPYQDTKCQICSGPPMICERLHHEETCTWPNNVCINELTNHDGSDLIAGSRELVRRCGTAQEANEKWLGTAGTSNNATCTNFDPKFVQTIGFKCTFACVTDSCNNDVVPPPSQRY